MGLLGGGKQKIPATGFYAMPPAYQGAYNSLLGGLNSILLPGGNVNADMFTPMGETADESRAFSLMRQGFAPTQQSLFSDIALQQNPYDRYVIDEINNQAAGDFSILKQAASQAGQFGSNRMMLGANDIDMRRLGQIGQFKQQGFNTALNNALTTLPQLRGADAAALLDIGAQQRDLAMQQQTAPFTALSSGLSALNSFPTQFGNFGAPAYTVKKGGGFGSILGSLGGRALGTWIGGPVGGQIGSQIGGTIFG